MVDSVLRTINADVRDHLSRGDPFVYAHLVKFEHGKLEETAEGSRRATDYAYISDASHDILFDDGSKNSIGGFNGAQTYIANRVMKVGDITTKIVPNAATTNLQLSALALNTNVTQDITITNVSASTTVVVDGVNESRYATAEITGTVNLVEVGFAEGDKVRLLMGNPAANNNITFRIDSFTNNNKTIKITCVAKSLISVSTAANATLDFASNEVIGPLNPRTVGEYASYLNRTVEIYKVHIDPTTGSIIGGNDGGLLLYKGIVSTAKLSEDATKSSKISWGLTSHWGDFTRVHNRITSDSEHRKIDASGQVDINSLVRKEYATDFGFQHSEQAINLLAQYVTIEKETRFGKKKKLFGKKMYTYEVDVEVTHEIDLKFNLQAKTIPVVYGVNKTKGVPIFIDTDKDDGSSLFVAYSLCEGQIGGIYDIHFDEVSTVCIDEADADSRSITADDEGTVDVVCIGRQDMGQTLGSEVVEDTANESTTPQFPGSHGYYSWMWNSHQTSSSATKAAIRQYQPKTKFTNAARTKSAISSTGEGVKHGGGTVFDNPIDSQFILHDGASNQAADTLLVAKAKDNGFKIQNDYFDNSREYWGVQHQLLDTAYISAQYTIGEGETTVPQQHFTVRGKLVECYNYDFMYRRDIRSVNGNSSYSHVNAANFYMGDTVTLHNSDDDTEITAAGSRELAEIRYVYESTPVPGEGAMLKVRFAADPELGSLKHFYIKKGNNKIFLQTWDATMHSGTVGMELKTTVTSVAEATADSAGVKVNVDTSPTGIAAAFRAARAISFNPFNTGFSTSELDAYQRYIALVLSNTYDYTTKDASNNNLADGQLDNIGDNSESSGELVGTEVQIKDAIRLQSSGSSSVTGYYVGCPIELTTLINGTPKTIKRIITAYDGSTKTATLDAELPDMAKITDSYKIVTSSDLRVTLNPALQLLDFLLSERYGPEMKLEEDIDHSTFLSAGRDCDERSNVIVSFRADATSGTFNAFSAGDKWRWPQTGEPKFIGTVKTVTNISSAYGPGGTAINRVQVEFKDVRGKLGYKWKQGRTYKAGDLVWYESKFAGDFMGYADGTTEDKNKVQSGVFTVDADGTTNIVQTPGNSAFAGTITNLTLETTNIPLRKVGTTSDLYLNLIPNFDGNPLVKSFDSGNNTYGKTGYTLYDSDDVKYWRYVGWDASEQVQVTRHQMSPVLDTSKTLLETTNSFLEHFGGMLRYNNGKYSLAIQQVAPTVFSSFTTEGVTYSPNTITEDDIIGPIQVDDAGQKGMYNTMSSTLSDPMTLFNERQVTFFNSTYLKQDKYVPKKGTASTPYITNYFNARMFAKLNLDLSRFSISINFTLGPKGILLLPGEIIKLTHDRFGWSNKLFRVTAMVLKADCLVRVTAEEHNESAYANINSLSNLKTTTSDAQTSAPAVRPSAPVSLSVGPDRRGGVDLVWVHPTAVANGKPFNANGNHKVEIWKHDNIDFSQGTGAKKVATSTSNNYTDQITAEGRRTNYYWIRYESLVAASRGTRTASKQLFSDYTPRKTADGVEGIADGAVDGTVVNMSNSNTTVTTDANDALVFTNTGNTIGVTIGSTVLPYDDTSPYLSPSFRVTFSASSSITTASTHGAGSGNLYTANPITGLTGGSGKITYTVTVKDTIDREVDYIVEQTFGKSLRGSEGTEARSVVLTGDNLAFAYSEDGDTPSPASTTLRATSLGTIGTPHFQFGSLASNGNFTQLQARSTTSTYTYTPPSSFDSLPQTLEVRLTEGSDSSTQYAADAVSIVGLKDSTSGLTVVIANDAHTLPANFLGVVTSYASSGTTIKLFEGATALTYDGTGTSNGTWKVTAVGTNITPQAEASFTDSGSFVTIGAASAMSNSSDTASIVYTITGKRANGSSISLTKDQTFTKSTSAIPVIAANLTNVFTSVPTTAAGLPTLTNSGTDIIVLENETTLTFTTGSLAASKYTVTAAGSSITPGTPAVISGSSNCRIPAHTNMLANTASVAYTISGQRADGTTFSRSLTQVISKNQVGATGTKTALVYAYLRSATEPSTNPGEVTVSLLTGKITTTSLGDSWQKEIPSGTDPLYVCAASAVATGVATTDTVAANDWSAPVILVQDGAAGINSATIFLYQRTTSSTAPALPTASATYTFSTKVLGAVGSWSRTIPTGDQKYVWVTTATAASNSNTDTIDGTNSGAAEWAAPSILSEKGDQGLGSRTVYAYRRSAADLSGVTGNAGPGAVTVTIATGVITTSNVSNNDLANSWEREIPTGNNPLYITAATATATPASETGDIAASGWSGAVILSKDGNPGNDGINISPLFLYMRRQSATEPGKPANSLTYTFPTNSTAGGFTGTVNLATSDSETWLVTPPATTEKYLWITNATAANTGTSDTITASEWASPTILSENGTNGIGVRGVSHFVIDASTANTVNANPANSVSSNTGSNSDYLNLTVAQSFNDTSSISGVTQQKVAALVTRLSIDGYIRKGDSITIVNPTTTNGGPFRAQRIWTAASSNAAETSLSTSGWSSQVVEKFNGSVIVDGTLAAGKIVSSSITGSQLKLHNESSTADDGGHMKLSADDGAVIEIYSTVTVSGSPVSTLRVKLGKLT